MQIAMSKTREQFPLSQMKPLKKTIASLFSLFLLIIMIALYIGIGSTLTLGIRLPPGSILLIFLGFMGLILITILTYLYQVWYFKVYFYDLTEDFIIIRKRVFTPREITIPYERVQDVYVDQDLLDRIFGLYDVHLSSATISSGIEAHIDGVEKPAAEGLRSLILQKVSEKIKKGKA